MRDRRIGKPLSRRAAVAEILRMLGLYEERYGGFTVKHFHEQLVKRHNDKLGYTVTRLVLHGAGLVKPAPRRSAPYEPDPGEGRGRAGLGPARHPSYRGRFGRGAGPFRAHLPHPPGPPAQGAGPGRDCHARGGQPVDRRNLSRGPRHPVSRWRRSRQEPLSSPIAPGPGARPCARKTSAGSATTTRSNGAVSICKSRQADCAPICARHGAHPRISRRPPGDLSRPPSPRRI